MSDFDTTWKDAIRRHCRDFFEFFFPKIACLVDWSVAPIPLDTELQKLAPKSDSGRLHADSLIQLSLLDGEPLLALVHIEVQSQVDALFAQRMVQYYWRIRDAYGTSRVCSLAILGDSQADWKPDHYESSFLGCHFRLDFPVCKLSELPAQPQDCRNPFAWLVAAHREAHKTRRNSRRRLEVKFRLVRELYRGLSKEQVRDFFRLVDGVLALSDDLSYAFWQKLARFEEEQSVVYLNSIERLILADARQEALAEGKAEGSAETLRKLLCRTARARWNLDVSAEVAGLDDLQRMESLMEVLVTAESAEVWLQQLRSPLRTW